MDNSVLPLDSTGHLSLQRRKLPGVEAPILQIRNLRLDRDTTGKQLCLDGTPPVPSPVASRSQARPPTADRTGNPGALPGLALRAARRPRARRGKQDAPSRRARTSPSLGPGPRAPGRSPFPFPFPWEPAAGGGGGRCPPHPARPPGAQKLGLPLPPPRLLSSRPASRRSRLPIRLQSTSQPLPRRPSREAGAGGGEGRGGGGGGRGRRGGPDGRVSALGPLSLPLSAGAGAAGPRPLCPSRPEPPGRGVGRAAAARPPPLPGAPRAGGGARGGPAGEAARPRFWSGARAGVAGEKSAAAAPPRAQGALRPLLVQPQNCTYSDDRPLDPEGAARVWSVETTG